MLLLFCAHIFWLIIFLIFLRSFFHSSRNFRSRSRDVDYLMWLSVYQLIWHFRCFITKVRSLALKKSDYRPLETFLKRWTVSETCYYYFPEISEEVIFNTVNNNTVVKPWNCYTSTIKYFLMKIRRNKKNLSERMFFTENKLTFYQNLKKKQQLKQNC